MKKWGLNIILITLLGGGLFLGLITPASAEAVDKYKSSNVSLSIESGLAIALDNCDESDPSNVSLDVGVANPFGVFASNCQILRVDTNSLGYQLSAKAVTTSTNPLSNDMIYLNPLPPNVLIPPVIAATSSPASNPAALTNNTWGFAVTSDDVIFDAPMDNFTSDYTDLADNTNKFANLPINDTTIYMTDEVPGENIFEFYYGARVNSDILAGTYQTVVIYTVTGEVTPPIPEPLREPSNYYLVKTTRIVPNFASTRPPSGNGSGSNGPQFSINGTGFGSNPTVTIGGQDCTDVVVNSAGTSITCTGPVIGMSDGETRVFINGVDVGNDYTVWYSSYNFPTLQSITTSGTCLGTWNIPVIYRDARDGQLYYVAKMQDEKCWMLDNLRYKPNGDTTGTVTPNFSAIQIAHTGSNNNLTVDGTTSSVLPNHDAPKYMDPISEAYCYNNTNKPAPNLTKCGISYNFYTATAGTAPYTVNTDGATATGSICPANWRLPTAWNISTTFADADFAVLDASMRNGVLTTPGTDSIGLTANWIPSGIFRGIHSGIYYNVSSGTSSSVSNAGTIGFYWSSSVRSNRIAYMAGYNGAYPYLTYSGGGGDSRHYGVGVRCVN